MIEEPYRWLEAIENRREYVKEQIKGGSPTFAVKLNDGIVLLAIGTGNSKVFELFDRHALAALGHPADIEKIRQAAIDAAHMEAFTRAPEDVSLRRLISFGISPQLKTNFEQIFSAPFLIEMLLAEVGQQPENDLVIRLHFDGSFEFVPGVVAVAANNQENEKTAVEWLENEINPSTKRGTVIQKLLQAWWALREGKSFTTWPEADEVQAGVKNSLKSRVIEIGWLDRHTTRQARFFWLTHDLG